MSPDSHQHGGSFAFSARAQAPHDHFCRVGKHSRRTQCRAQVREQVPDAGVQRPFLAQTYRPRHVAGQKRISSAVTCPVGSMTEDTPVLPARTTYRPVSIARRLDCALCIQTPRESWNQESLVDTASS